MKNNINPLSKMNELKSNGYTEEYIFRENKMCCINSNNKYSPEEVEIMKEYRFEGKSNPSDMSILYAIRTQDGRKGQVLVSYGPKSGNTEVHEFMMASEDNG